MVQLKQRKPRWFSNNTGVLAVTPIMLLIFLLGCKRDLATQQIDGVYTTENEYDFGIIPDSVTEVSHAFVLQNNSKDTCKIIDVEKSCGCTKIDLDSNIINPHDSIKINIHLDIGSNFSFIEKDVNIYTNISNSPLTLYLRATRRVPQVVIKRQFPFKISKNFRLSASSALLGYAQHGQDRSFSINVMNTSDEPRTLVLKSKMPEGFSVILPSKIAPQEISRIVFTCNLKETLWGEIAFDCVFQDGDDESTPIKVYTIATERFDRKKKTFPRICVPVSAYKSKVINQEQKIFFKFINVGQDTLMIRHIQCSNKDICVYPDKNNCIPNDTCNIIADFSNHDLIEDDITIGVTTNDKI